MGTELTRVLVYRGAVNAPHDGGFLMLVPLEVVGMQISHASFMINYIHALYIEI